MSTVAWPWVPKACFLEIVWGLLCGHKHFHTILESLEEGGLGDSPGM